MPSDLDNKVAAPNNSMKCIYWNVRSISGEKNVKHLQHYIKKKQVDLLFLSETWERKGNHLPELPGYNLLSCVSGHGGGRGGVVCYFKQEYSPYITGFKNDSQGHYLWLKLDKALGFEKDLFAAVCYFPPPASTAYKGRDRHSEANFPYTSLSNDIFSLISRKMKTVQCDVLVVGDFNGRVGDEQAPEAHRHGMSRQSADKKSNKFGRPLMDVCDINDLTICNGVTQVWPKSGETTCRSRSVVDYILAPVSRARFLVKDIEILPLEKKSDHNAMNFTLRRPRPLHGLPSPDDEAAHLSSTSVEEAELRRPLSKLSPTEAPNQTMSCSGQCSTSAHLKELKSDSSKKPPPAPEVASDGSKEEYTGPARIGHERSPMSVRISRDDWESTTNRERPLQKSGTSFLLRHDRGLAELGSIMSTRPPLYEVTTSEAQDPSPPEMEVTRSVKCDPYTRPREFNATDQWFQSQTSSRLLNTLILADHMLLSQQAVRHRKHAPTDQGWHPVFPNFETSYMTKNEDALTKVPSRKHNPTSNKLVTINYTRSIAVVQHPWRFVTFLQDLKSAHDSGKLWKSLTRTIAKAIR